MAERTKNTHRSLESKPKKTSIEQLRGLGKQKWKGVDGAKHGENERQSWEGTSRLSSREVFGVR